MEEMQGENTEYPYENGTVQPCRFLSACIGQETPGICLMEIRTELLHGDKMDAPGSGRMQEVCTRPF